MRITYDEAFDRGAWPGPGGGKAVAGELWVGLSGVLGTLEGLTGLSRHWPSHAARVASLLPALPKTPGFWAASAKTDPLSTAERLLELRDTLALHGWKGAVASPRLRELEALALHLDGSPGDRLAALAAVLRDFPRLVESVTLLGPREALPRRVEECLAALETRGARVEVAAPARAAAPKNSDLARARAQTAFTPSSDGSLQLIRPYAPYLAADAVAAALAADPRPTTVVIGADAVLDQALARHGLPTVGGSGDSSDNAVLQLLPLVLAMGATPQDPARVVELLTLPVGPVRGVVARRLVRALQKWPAVGSSAWDEALSEGLDRIEEPADRERVRERLAALFTGTVQGSTWPMGELAARTQALRTWLMGREEHAPDDDARARFGAALIQCAEFDELLRASGVTQLSTAQLKLFLERATSSVDGGQRYPARAGLRGVGVPGSLAGPVERLVWWNFSLDSAPTPRPAIWSRRELDALSAAGVRLPSPGEQARRINQRFRRPLDQTSHALWLVCPERGPDGAETAPHPLWDEVLGLLGESRHARALTFSTPRVSKSLPVKKRTALPLPEPRQEWLTHVKLEKRELESASSLESLLGCPLQWTLRYQGKLSGGQTASLPADTQLLGSLAHEVVGQALAAGPASPDAAAEEAERRFEKLGPTHAAPLFLPGRDAERAEALQAARDSARQLAQLLEAGWQVEGVELPVQGKAVGTALEGRLDLVLKKGKARAVVDLKWGGESYRRDALGQGASVQLATYAELLRQNGAEDVAVGYFILLSQAMLSTDARLATKGAALPAAFDTQDTWKSVEKAWKERWKRTASGTLLAPGVMADAPEHNARDEDGALVVAAPCRYCDFTGLCGKTYGVIEEREEEEDDGRD